MDPIITCALRFVVLLLAVPFPSSAAEPGRFFLYRSTDQGRSWERSDSGLPENARINAIFDANEAIVTGTDAGLFVSNDSGKTWKSSKIIGTKEIRVVAVAGTKNQIFAAAADALLVSTDAGATWARSVTFPKTVVRSLLVHANTLYAGTDADGVYTSTDLGRTWTELTDGLPPNAQVFAFTALRDQVFAGLYSAGLYKLDHSQNKWRQVGAVDGIQPLALASVEGTVVAGHNPGGIFLSNDLGQTWTRWHGESSHANSIAEFDFSATQSSVSLEAPVWDLVADNGIVFAGVADGIFYSEDEGRTWVRAAGGLPKISPGIAFLVRSNLVLAATLTNYRSRSQK